MAQTNPAAVEHLFVNRVEIGVGQCSACGAALADVPPGAPVLNVKVASESGIRAFCAGCGEAILGHVSVESVRDRYAWDWAIPLRTGIVEADLAEEVSVASHAASTGDGPFQAFGKTYDSERAAIVAFVNKVRTGEANGAEAFTLWAAVCTSDRLRAGIRMIAEREAYHARFFADRLQELGAESPGSAEAGGRFKQYLGDPAVSDREKLSRLATAFGDPMEYIKPICYFAALIKKDIQTREALLLFAEDEVSTLSWIRKTLRAR